MFHVLLITSTFFNDTHVTLHFPKQVSHSGCMNIVITNKLVLVNNIFLYKFASWCFQGDVCKLSAEFS